MISGGNATLSVSDLDRAVRFYVETLGFKLRVRAGDDWAEVDAGGGLVLGLHRVRGAAAGDGGAKPGTHGSVRVGFDLNQPIAEVVAVLANRGVQFRGPVREGAVRLAFFQDPDGNALYLAEPNASAQRSS